MLEDLNAHLEPEGIGGESALAEAQAPRTAILIAAIIAVTVFVLDITLPLGVAGGVPYVALVLVGWWFPKSKTILILAAIATVLTIVGYFVSPHGGIEWVVYTNRAYAIFAIWVTAIILWIAWRARADVLRSELNLKQAKQKAEQASIAKSRFLSSMSHELRTPLNAVIGFGQLMQHNPQEPLTTAQQEYTTNIITSGELLLELINGVLDLAKIEADQLHISIEDIYVDTIVNECIPLVMPSANDRNITIENNMNNQARCLIQADGLRLKQVLLNFLSNAVKYNRPGGKVVLTSDVTDGGQLRLAVSDTGIGIPRDLHGDIFKPFERLGIEAKKTIEGTGIGLTVAKQLIQRMGGRIGFDSEENVGSTFWVELPQVAMRSELHWTSQMSVGIEQIDEDHKVLIALLNDLSDSIFEAHDIDETIEQLLDYTNYHFRREEAEMAALGYPHLEEHRRVHQHLAAKVQNFAEQWRNGGDAKVVQALLEFLRTWLVDHIMQNDAEVQAYIRAKGQAVDDSTEKRTSHL